MHILLVEDDKTFGRVLKTELEDERHQVDVAGDGVEGVLSFLDTEFDLVLLDLRMPRLDGMDTLRILKRLSPEVPVIVISAEINARDAADMSAAGARVFLIKPFEISRLKREIDQVDPPCDKNHEDHEGILNGGKRNEACQ